MQIQEQQQQPSPGLRKYIKYCNKLNKNCPGVNYNFIYEDDVQQLFKIKNFKFLILRARISYIVCKITVKKGIFFTFPYTDDPFPGHQHQAVVQLCF